MSDAEKKIADRENDAVELEEYLAFVSDDLNIAVSAQYVIEIITENTITKIPRVPAHIKGMFNLRGQIIPIVDMRIRLRQPVAECTDMTCIIVVQADDVSIGLQVDMVSHVLNIHKEKILPPPANNTQDLVKGIVHIEDVDYLILDCELLVR
jgi:purine-binding chemotaxis protein CheW